ncbi:MAG: hypothetical protein GY842_24210 [bacterium]|nr:hypothetical protein [bacterium]
MDVLDLTRCADAKIVTLAADGIGDLPIKVGGEGLAAGKSDLTRLCSGGVAARST